LGDVLWSPALDKATKGLFAHLTQHFQASNRQRNSECGIRDSSSWPRRRFRTNVGLHRKGGGRM